MTTAPATLAELQSVLRNSDADDQIIFESPHGRAGPGYHVTELKLADVQSIDCGGRRDAWREAQVQILDGQGRGGMSAKTLDGILDKSFASIDGLADAPLSLEFSPGNRGLSRYSLGTPQKDGELLVLPLVATAAVCKPALEFGCCGASSSSCC